MARTGSTGRAAPRPKQAPLKKAPTPTYGSEAAYTGSSQQQKAGTGKVVKAVKAASNAQYTGTETSIAPKQQQKAGNNRTQRAISQKNNTPIESAGGAGAKYETTALKLGTATQRANKDKFGFSARLDAPVQRTQSTGGTVSRTAPTRTGGGGGGLPERYAGSNQGLPNRTGGNDPDLVGSEGHITNFDGSQDDWGSSNDVSGGESFAGGGGGTGDALAGRGSVGNVGQLEGQSMDEIVYGVRKKGKKSTIRRGLGE